MLNVTTTTDLTSLVEAMEERLAERIFDADGPERFPVLDLVPGDTLDEDEDFDLIMAIERLDLRIDVTTWPTFPGSLEEPPEYASGGDWALLDGPTVIVSGRILDEGEWEGDPFSFLRR